MYLTVYAELLNFTFNRVTHLNKILNFILIDMAMIRFEDSWEDNMSFSR